MQHYYAYVFIRIMQALGRTGFAAFMSARHIPAKRALCTKECQVAAA